MSAALSHIPALSGLAIIRPTRPGSIRRGIACLLAWAAPSGYRPERHYMRGGTTEGSRSLDRARRQIARRA
jgi:hypothetical protein